MNSLEEVMLEVYRLDHAEFDAPPKHRFSRRHDKAMKEILYPDYSMMVMDYRIEQSRVSPKKRILVAVLVIILAVIGTAAGAAAVNVLKRRTENVAEITKVISSSDATWLEDGMFYEIHNADGESVLCYYSKEKDRSAVMCGMPECTHRSKLSPDCGALADSNTVFRYGFNRVGDKLYYIEEKMSDENSIGLFNLIESDIDGKNRRAAASINDAYIPFVKGIKYIDGHILLSYCQQYDLVENEGTGEIEFKELDKIKFYIQWIDLSTKETETLLYREEYGGRGRGMIYENVLYYSYIYYDVPPTGELLTPETAPPQRGGFYVRDLSTGEEKLYEGFLPLGDSFEYFSPYTIMAQSIDDEKIYLFDPETETFNAVADCSGIGYTSDGKDAMFKEEQDSEFWTRYNFETGELTRLPIDEESLGIFLYGVHEVGDTVWLAVDTGYAYMDRDDFYNGKFENFKMIKEVELK